MLFHFSFFFFLFYILILFLCLLLLLYQYPWRAWCPSSFLQGFLPPQSKSTVRHKHLPSSSLLLQLHRDQYCRKHNDPRSIWISYLLPSKQPKIFCSPWNETSKRGNRRYYIFPSKRCPLIKFQYSAICLHREIWNCILTAFVSSMLSKLSFYMLGVLQYQFEGKLAYILQ